MQSCLGISTENNLIKYAKVSKDRDNVNVESFGVKFYDKLENAVNQIVEETQSENTPIVLNLPDPIYNKFDVFNGLKKKDVDSLLASEFELLCEDKKLNYQALTSQFILSEKPLDREQNTAIYISADKGNILGTLQRLENNKISFLVPISAALYNLIETNKENTAIINIEDKTTITSIANRQIINIQELEIGMQQILDRISKKENSYARAYEACKNTTIYTMEITESQLTGNEYLEDIMPILYEIVTQTKELLDSNFIAMQKIYLTGTATIINNLELYFQEYFEGIKCQILTPSFVEKKALNTNVKEIIEVNSAIALALQGLGEGLQEINFKNTYTKKNIIEEIKEKSTKDVGSIFKKSNSSGSKKSFSFNFSLKGALDRIEKDMLRIASTLFLLMLIFSIISVVLSNMINDKIKQVDIVIADTNAVIAEINNNTTKTTDKTKEYQQRIDRLNELTNQIRTEYKLKRAIPNLLSQIMAVIPKDVQLTSINNITENKVIIKAQAEKYEELGYFGAVLKNQGILLNVKTTSGTRENNLVKIDIEGNLQ